MKTAAQLVDEANARVRTVSPKHAHDAAARGEAVLVDIRDIRELGRMGRVPDAVHAPRGMLEFWFDPESEYHKRVFAQDRTYILFCAAAGRSALAARSLQEMGFDNIAHMEGGFGQWRDEGLPVESPVDSGESGDK